MKAYNGYTTIEQSKNLKEILPVESADMYYTARIYGEQHEIIGTSWELHLGLDAATKDHLFSFRNGYAFPCWSLFALLDILPNLDNRYPVMQRAFDGRYRVIYHSTDCERGIFTHDHKNPVDACVEMIIKLHELNLLVS